MNNFDEPYKAVPSKSETRMERDAHGNNRYYLHSDSVKKNFKYTGKFLRENYDCCWIDEDETEFIIKDDEEVVKA